MANREYWAMSSFEGNRLLPAPTPCARCSSPARGAIGQTRQRSFSGEEAAQAVEELGAKPSEVKTVVEPNRLPGYGEQDVARQEQLRTAERIAQKFGAELEVAELPNGVDGEYLDGKIIISPRAANPVMTVAVHELTHHMESSSRYGEFSRMILDYVSDEMGVDIDTMKNAICSEYAKGGFELDDVGAERELVAKFAESKLFQDEAAINRLARTNRSMFQTVKDWISDMVVKLTGTEEEKFFRNAERLYEKALREVGDTANNNGWQARYSISSHLMDELMSVLDGTFNSRKNEVYIGESSNFLTDTIKADALSETMPPNKAYSAMVTKEQAIHDGRYREGVNYHGLGPEGLLRALVASEDPIAAFADTSNGADKRVNNIILVTDEKIDGQYIIVTQALEVPARLEGKRLTANKVITAFDRSAIADDLVRAEAEHRLLHLDEKRSQTLLAGGSAYDSLRDIREADFERNIQLFWDRVKWAKSGMHEYTAEGQVPTETELGRKLREAMEKKARESQNSAESYGRSFDEFAGDAQRLPTMDDSTSYTDALREMQQSGTRQPTSYTDGLAHINELLQNAALSPRDQAHIQEDIADAQRSCDAAMKAIVNPGTTAEERTQAVRRAIDALDYARQRINDLGLPATQLGVSTAQDVLANIFEKLKPYLDNLGGFREP